MKIGFRVLFCVLALIVLSFGVIAKDAQKVGSGIENLKAGCTGSDLADGKGTHFVCGYWGPVEWKNPESYASQLADQGRSLTACKKKLACGCISGGDFSIPLPAYEVPTDEKKKGEPQNVDAKIDLVVSGSGKLTLLWGTIPLGSVTGASKEPAAVNFPLVDPVTKKPLITQSGPNTISFFNDKTTISTQSCFHVSYEYDFMNDSDSVPNVCTNNNGAWINTTDEDLEFRCCGNDPQAGGDFMNVVTAVDSDHPDDRTKDFEAMCIVDASGKWQWLTKKEMGNVANVKFIDGEKKWEGTAVYTDAGPRYCGPSLVDFEGATGDPQKLEIEMAANAKSEDFSAYQATGAKPVMHGFACAMANPLANPPAVAAVECYGGDPKKAWTTIATIGGDAGFKKTYKTGETVNSSEDGETEYFCTESGAWMSDIDDQETCEAASNSDPKIQWTGTHCCGFRPGQYYNEPALTFLNPDSQKIEWKALVPPAGCWNSTPIQGVGTQNPASSTAAAIWRFVGERIPYDKLFINAGGTLTNRSIMNYNGTFYGCNMAGNTVLSRTWCIPGKATCNADKTGFVEYDGKCNPIATACPTGRSCVESEKVEAHCARVLPKYKCGTAPATDPNTRYELINTELKNGKKCADINPLTPNCSVDTCVKNNDDGSVTAYFKAVLKVQKTGCYAAIRPDDLGDNAKDLETVLLPATDDPKLKSCYDKEGKLKPTANKKCFRIVDKKVFNGVAPKDKAAKAIFDYVKCYNWMTGNEYLSAKATTTQSSELWKIGGTGSVIDMLKKVPACSCGAQALPPTEGITKTSIKSAIEVKIECIKCKTPTKPDKMGTATAAGTGKPMTGVATLYRCFSTSYDHRTTTTPCKTGFTEEAKWYIPKAAKVGGTTLAGKTLYSVFVKDSVNDYMTTTNVADSLQADKPKRTTLGYLLASATPEIGGAAVALYSCVTVDGKDHYDSTDPACEGQQVVGDGRLQPMGYVWKVAPTK
jgi:hypothetical protein